MMEFTYRDNTLIFSFDKPYRTLSWAILNGGFNETMHIINHYVPASNYSVLNAPVQYLQQTVKRLKLKGFTTGMVTGVNVAAYVAVKKEYQDLKVSSFVTAGCGNLLSVADPATFYPKKKDSVSVGTINIVVVIEKKLTDAAMVEAIQIITEAKVKAVYEMKLKSKITEEYATGTGTDCIAIASENKGIPEDYCGKHTKLGELIGAAVLESVQQALQKTL